jgi:hypothetical protein
MPIMMAASPTSTHAVTLSAYKALAIMAAVDFGGAKLKRPAEYSMMDPSEKANISFWTGMTFASLVANDILDVPWLFHAAAFRRLGLLTVNPNTRSLTDLIGLDERREWHSIEAKARQDGASPADRASWKRQANTIATANGQVPATCSYAFTRVADPYFVEVHDPPSDQDASSLEVAVSEANIVKGYYGSVLEWIVDAPAGQADRTSQGGISIVMRPVALDPASLRTISLGLADDAIGSLRDDHLPKRIDPLDEADCFIGTDSIAVVVVSPPTQPT